MSIEEGVGRSGPNSTNLGDQHHSTVLQDLSSATGSRRSPSYWYVNCPGCVSRSSLPPQLHRKEIDRVLKKN
jgi:hypothetical protein